MKVKVLENIVIGSDWLQKGDTYEGKKETLLPYLDFNYVEEVKSKAKVKE